MNTAYLLTGGNVGNRAQYLHESAHFIEAACGKIIRRSSVYETAAWGKTDQAAFLNQVLELSTLMAADSLMQQLLLIEHTAGRKRAEKYGPRTIDIDILLFNNAHIETALVTIPHLQMANRRFVLEPLNELVPQYTHPVLQLTIADLLQRCTDPLTVKKFSVL